MSFRRTQSRAINHHVFLDNRLTNFVGEHVHFGDLIVERDALINGNLTVKKDISARSFYATGNYYLDNYILIPAGTIVQSASINVPDGWLNCNGSLLNKIAYVDLFLAIGNTYGGEPTDLSFNLPDMRGRVGIGAGQGVDLSNRVFATSGGEETHTLSIEEIPSHSHGSNAVGGQGNLGLTIADGNGTPVTGDESQGELNVFTLPRALTINNAGSGNAHNNMQPFLVIRYLIKY
jgi:microcystin-dependent protein